MPVLYDKQELYDVFSEDAECFLLPDCSVQHVCVDSRFAGRGSLFCAIVGKRVDGHDFIKETVDAGAVCVIVQKVTEPIYELHKQGLLSIIKVADTLQALSKLARYCRNRLSAKVIAVTGSMGKTTVRHMLQNVLSSLLTDVHATPGNYNTIYGVSLTLANTSPGSKVLVLELGMNHAGEIAQLSDLVRPHIAIITCIASNHIGNFKSKDAIMEAKSEIFCGMDNNGVIILNSDDVYCDRLSDIARKHGIVNIFRVGSTDKTQIYLKEHSYVGLLAMNYVLMYRDGAEYKALSCRINSILYQHAFNSLFVFAVARLFSLGLQDVAAIVSDMSMLNDRGGISLLHVKGKRITVIDESYNCSSDGMLAALDNLGTIKSRFPWRRVVCFIGDILELGPLSEDMHKSLAPKIVASKVDLVYTVGRYMKYLYSVLPQDLAGHHFQNSGALANKICSILQDGDVALFKASNAVNMSKVVDRLYRL